MIDFPNAPTVGQVVTAPNGQTWRWNGTTWLMIGSPSAGGGVVQVGSAVGVISAFSGDTVPPDSLVCDGAAVPAGTAYDALRAIVGANVPDLRDKFLLGAGALAALRATGGEATHVLTTPEMPSHQHISATFAFNVPAGSSATALSVNGSANNQPTSLVGGGAAHNNMPPYYAVRYIIQARPTMVAVGGGGSGFTFTQDTAPAATRVGDTWFNTSSAAGGGSSFVAIDNGTGALKWVQFAPGSGPSVAPVFRKFSAASIACGASVSTTLPFADNVPDTLGGVGNRTAGFFNLTNKGIYTIGVTAAWATTWGPGISASLRLISTANAGSTVNAELGSQGLGPHAHGYTTNTFILDHHAGAVATPNLEYMLTVWTYGVALTLSSLAVTVSKVSDR